MVNPPERVQSLVHEDYVWHVYYTHLNSIINIELQQRIKKNETEYYSGCEYPGLNAQLCSNENQKPNTVDYQLPSSYQKAKGPRTIEALELTARFTNELVLLVKHYEPQLQP